MEVALVLWLLMGLVAGLIASQKGRSATGFGCLGVVLGPIGILIALIAAKGDGKVGHNQKRCPECMSVVPVEARTCAYCRHRFTEVLEKRPWWDDRRR